MADERRCAALVVDNGDLLPLAPEPQHRRDEVRSGRREETRRAYDPRPLARRTFAVELRPAVRGEGVRSIRFDVRLAFTAVEDVVRREVHKRDPELCHVMCPTDVDGRGALRI